MRAQAAGEQTVPVGDVHDVARTSARGADRAGHQRRPGLDVASRIAHDRRLSGRSAGGVQTDDVGSRHREHSEGIAVPEILLRGERKPREIGVRRSSGCAPIASHLLRYAGTLSNAWRTDHLSRASWRASSSSRLARSIGSRSAGARRLFVMPVTVPAMPVRSDARPSHADVLATISRAAGIRSRCRRNRRTTPRTPCWSASSSTVSTSNPWTGSGW